MHHAHRSRAGSCIFIYTRVTLLYQVKVPDPDALVKLEAVEERNDKLQKENANLQTKLIGLQTEVSELKSKLSDLEAKVGCTFL